MDEIFLSAKAFEKLLGIVYDIKISLGKRKLQSFILDFRKKDFYHLVGLQYLKDLDLGKSPSIILDNILSGRINDSLLSKSSNYLVVDENYVVVKERIAAFQYIEECLDSKSIIFKYVRNKNPYSKIDADFLLEVSLNSSIYYIFLKQRKKEETYRLCSFFEKRSDYYGNKAYWLYKEKIHISSSKSTILYNRIDK